MRLVSVELSGFRGFAQRVAVDLDADAVVVVGANGNGKTSLFDGILWALTGRVPRLAADDARLVSMFSETGQAWVRLQLRATSDAPYTITRSFDGEASTLLLETPSGQVQGAMAEAQWRAAIWPDALAATDAGEALTAALTCSVYLQQDTIREFVDARTDHDRFAAISELVGAGRVTELQARLEREKKAWSEVTNQRQRELAAVRNRSAEVEARLTELTTRRAEVQGPSESEQWASYAKSLVMLGVDAGRMERGSHEAGNAINDSINQLEALRRAGERRVQALRGIQADMRSLASRPPPRLDVNREELIRLEDERDHLRLQVSQEQTKIADLRRQQASLKDRSEQLRTLAALALQHLEENCPVCAQDYDREATRERLLGIVETSPVVIEEVVGANTLDELLVSLAAKEQDISAYELVLRESEQAIRERARTEKGLSDRLSEAGLADVAAESDAVIERAIDEQEARLRQATELQREGEALALRLAQGASDAAIEEARREAIGLREELAQQEKAIRLRTGAGEKAQAVIEALRYASTAVVDERLGEIGPLLQTIYARIDPHPAFRAVSFLGRLVRGRGELITRLTDSLEEKYSDHPAAVLSSSQVNALAISVFLALNLGLPNPPLSTAIFDDPLQSLDEINLLGLVDLLRRSKNRRQLLVSTHDAYIGDLLSRKLRPASSNSRTVVVELEGWTRQGPKVTMREVNADPVKLRLVA